jgi:hypothetical protein
MRKASWGLGLAVILTATMAHAQAHGQSTYGSAGCGLGSMIFGDQKGLIQVLASTTNYTVWSQTFGITSGTSNCGEAGFSTQATRIFIEGNREALAKDAARGNGETITTLSAMAGCKDAKAVGSTLQKRFAQIFPGEKTPVEQVSQNVIQELRGDSSLACKNIG